MIHILEYKPVTLLGFLMYILTYTSQIYLQSPFELFQE